jgi:hypothetical protein
MIKNYLKFLRKLLLPSWTDFWPEIIEKSRKLNTLQLGSGRGYLKSATNIDFNKFTNPDVIHDLNIQPYPFRKNSFDMVVAISILEHLTDFFAVMSEIHRVSKANADVFILVPHFSSSASFIDPTHKLHLSSRSCDYFINGTELEKSFGFYIPYRFAIKKRIISLQGIWDYLIPIRWLVNKYPDIWEDHFCYLVRGAGVYWELQVKK